MVSGQHPSVMITVHPSKAANQDIVFSAVCPCVCLSVYTKTEKLLIQKLMELGRMNSTRD